VNFDRPLLKYGSVTVLIALLIAANYKLITIRQLAFSDACKIETKIKLTAEKIRSGEKVYTPEEFANLLTVSNDRDSERYVYNALSLFSLVSFNLIIAFYFLGYSLGIKKERDLRKDAV